MMYYGWNSFGSFMGLGIFATILMWAVVILGIMALTRWLMEDRRSTEVTKHALDILDERLAKGEITSDEYKEHKTLLQG